MDLKQELVAFTDSPFCRGEENEVVAKMLQLFDSAGQRAFSRENLEAHFTASAFVVDPADDRILLILHKKLQKWLQPGGHADKETDLLKVASKEVQEECGDLQLLQLGEGIFNVDWHQIPKHNDVPQHIHADVAFLFACKNPEAIRKNEEIIEIAWFYPEDCQEMILDSSLRRMVNKWVELSRDEPTPEKAPLPPA